MLFPRAEIAERERRASLFAR